MFERITNLYILIAMLNPQECTNLFKESLFERVEESNLRILRIPSLLPNIPQFFFFFFLIIPCLTALARPKCLSCELHLWSINQLELSHPLAPKKKKKKSYYILNRSSPKGAHGLADWHPAGQFVFWKERTPSTNEDIIPTWDHVACSIIGWSNVNSFSMLTLGFDEFGTSPSQDLPLQVS